MIVCIIKGFESEKEMLNSRKCVNNKEYIKETTCYINIKELAKKFFL